MFSLLTLLISIVGFQINAELIIKPSESMLIRYQHKSFIALCTGQANTQVIGWRLPQKIDIIDNENNRVTVERQINGIRLRIRNLTIDDQGTWECIGKDVNGQQIRKSFNMTIKVPITFQGDSIQYIAFGESAVIKCHVQANPVAEISWFKGQEKVRIENSNYELFHDGLRINRVEMSDNDTFWCRADVLETGESRDYPITAIVSQPIGRTQITCESPCAIEKKTAILTCEASGLPQPKYLWFYGSDSSVSASELPKFVARGNQLTINYVDENDNGKYSCHAFNEFDRKGQRAEYNLNVIVPPHLSAISPMEINFDSQHTQRISFQCRVERGSSDSLTLEWQYLNKTSIQSTNGIIIDRTQYETNKLIELRFDPVRREHAGNYSCVAKNLAASASSMASLLIQFQPIFIGPNVNVIPTVPNYRSIMRCQFEAYPAPQIQWIKMSRTLQDPEGRILAIDIDNGVNDITTKQIEHNIYESILSYTPTERDIGLSFECRALNPRMGRHSFTLQRAKPPKKLNITRIKALANAIEIFFHPSNISELPVQQYIVKYDLQNTDETQLQTLIIPAKIPSQKMIKIENLTPSTDYKLTIAAESRAGVGQSNSPITFRTLDKQIPNFMLEEYRNKTCSSDESCLITWNIESDGGAPILRAELIYGQAKNDEDFEIDGPLNGPIIIDSSTSEYELFDLKPDTSYIVIMKLYNEVGIAEEKTRIRTSTISSDGKIIHKNSIMNDQERNQPSKWAILGIILVIILSALAVTAICVVLRVSRLNDKHKTSNSDHQTTPMMNSEHNSEKTNGSINCHSSSTKFDDNV